jgi:hypothetical protein
VSHCHPDRAPPGSPRPSTSCSSARLNQDEKGSLKKASDTGSAASEPSDRSGILVMSGIIVAALLLALYDRQRAKSPTVSAHP